ncbi:hypothetical protein CEXT_167791 [Caerostris extrusa]|uniref:Uncharacterized protein n=1 Tax=Caerostris extrusa TaxID=172846 RepID=A0AAV4MPT8_CAEEX|nr:hypothetical protein CEXT_167791 [Caerostris extrusa]
MIHLVQVLLPCVLELQQWVEGVPRCRQHLQQHGSRFQVRCCGSPPCTHLHLSCTRHFCRFPEDPGIHKLPSQLLYHQRPPLRCWLMPSPSAKSYPNSYGLGCSWMVSIGDAGTAGPARAMAEMVSTRSATEMEDIFWLGSWSSLQLGCLCALFQ